MPPQTDALTLTDDAAGSSVAIVPARGAIVTRFRVRDRELLYLDEATLNDPNKNVRGGIPILFPSPGRLTGDRFARDEKFGAMKQHGFARDLPWSVERMTAGDAPSVSLALESNDATLAQFRWTFRATFLVQLEGARLSTTMTIENTSDREPLPFALGYHPYFAVKDKSRLRIATKATRAFDNVAKKVVPFTGFDLRAGEVDLHLLDHGSSESELTYADGARLALRASPELARWVVWTLPEKEFVCVEPWTAPGDALNTGESLIELAPHEKRELRFGMEYVDPQP